MSEYGALSANGVGMKNDAFADAVQRARQVRRELGDKKWAAGELVS